MANAILRGATFNVNPDTGAITFDTDIIWRGTGVNGAVISSISVPVGATDTLAQMKTKIGNAIDASGVSAGLGAPSTIVGFSIEKLR